MPAAVNLADVVPDAEHYRELQVRVPRLDEHKAVRLSLRFSGAGDFDRTSSDDLALFEAARLGCEIRLIVVGEVSSKTFRLEKKSIDEDERSYVCTVKVLSVEAGEIA